jgi:hypothetical protein
VHTVVANGAREVLGQVTVPTFASNTDIGLSVTLPVFVTVKSYAIVDPAVSPLGAPALLSKVIVAVRVIGVATESVAETTGPAGGVPDAVAVLFTDPASTSAWVRV